MVWLKKEIILTHIKPFVFVQKLCSVHDASLIITSLGQRFLKWGPWTPMGPPLGIREALKKVRKIRKKTLNYYYFLCFIRPEL